MVKDPKLLTYLNWLIVLGFLFISGLKAASQNIQSIDYKELGNNKTPKSIAVNLKKLKVQYINFEGKLDSGEVICHKWVANDLFLFFNKALAIKFPFKKVSSVAEFNNSDEASMLANNTSCFNYRTIAMQKRISLHGYGLAIDVNPIQNPMIKRGKVSPKTGNYNPKNKGTLFKEHPLVLLMTQLGWQWGGNWPSHTKDYQHFEKRLNIK